MGDGTQNSILNERLRESFLNELEELAAAANGDLHLSLLGGMILHQFAEFKIAIPLTGGGMYHEKRGIAVDELGQIVAFFGSANETMAGWGKDGNVEAIDVFRSWIAQDFDRAADHVEKFDQVWQGRRKGILVKSLPAALNERLLRAAPPNQDEFYRKLKAYQRLRVADMRTGVPENPFDQLIAPLGQRHLDANQIAALQAWVDANCRGLLKLATGAGKTLTALRAVRLHTNDGLPSLILVPSKLLLRQWQKEIAEELPECTVMLAGDGHVRWAIPGRLEAFLSPNTTGERRIILATMQTASSESFRSLLKNHLVQHLLLIADEVHQLGSLENRNLFRVNAGKRLGLSATPERFGDPEGTALLMEYFGGIVGPVVTLGDAIRSGRLVPYRYFPHFATLSEPEREEWADISSRIRKAYGRLPRDAGGKPIENERIRLLKIQRSWIPKRASQKARITQKILHDHFQVGQHWLVYCENQNQIKDISDACMSMGIKALAYHTAMAGDAETTMGYFIQYGGVLLSIRCLDEGVDIPVISHAIILASSQNPRQFIQRRGRVLRAHKGKVVAEIHDVLVVPSSMDNDDQDSLTLSEFVRAIEFAKDSINQAEASLLREKAMDFGLSLADIYDTGDEVAQIDID
jgi:superfamily II DNA or RNA helicase